MYNLEHATIVAADLALLSAYKADDELVLHDCLMESESILNSIMLRQIDDHPGLSHSVATLARHIKYIKTY